MNPRLEALRRQIEGAFLSVPYPGDRNIGSDPDYWECVEINEHFRGRHWTDIPREALQYHQHDLPFFSPEGLHYYLPTYLFAGLDDFGDTLSFTVYDLAPDEGELRARWSQRYDGFTPAQKQAVRAWLEYVRDEMPRHMDSEDVTAALERYWGRDWT